MTDGAVTDGAVTDGATDADSSTLSNSYTQQELFGDGTAYGSFGQSVSLSSDGLVVGQPTSASGNGAAYVFRKISGAWSSEQELAGGASFGTAVSMSGDTLVVGAPDGALPGGNAAYVYVRAAGIWSLQATLLPDSIPTDGDFGLSVAVSGDTAVVGAPMGGADTDVEIGRAYVFVRSGTTWTQQAKLAPAEAILMDRPGASVAISGDTVVIGAPTNPTFSTPAPGKAYVFTRSGTAWAEQAAIAASDGVAKNSFGYSVSVVADSLLVGATCPCAGAGPGSAYAFTRTGGAWSQVAKLVSADSVANDQFGYQVSLDVGRAAVSAYQVDSNQGAVYEFVGAAGTWTRGRKLIASDGAANDNLGFSVALENGTVAAGATSESHQAPRAGAAYVFTLE